jgi:phage host-nuclease inhibitor protein Gam
MAQLNMKQASAPPKTAEERAQYQNARKELGASMKGLWESFGALANENEQVSETREKYAPEIQSITKELNTLVRQLGHGKILRDFHQARKNQG